MPVVTRSAQRSSLFPGYPPPVHRDRPAAGLLTLDRRAVLRCLLALTAALVVVGTVAALALRAGVPFALDSLGRLVLLDAEANVASWWGSALLLACAGGFVLASGALPEQRWRLRLLAVLLLLLSLDETAILHERATGALLLAATGSAEGDAPVWVLAALPLVALTAWFVLPVLRGLPAAVRRRWWLAGALYLGGAIGVEVVTNLLTGPGSAAYLLGVALEEGLEYAGPIVLLDSLLLLAGAAPLLPLAWQVAGVEAYPSGSSSPSPRAQDVV